MAQIEGKREAIREIAAAHGATSIAVFGSVAGGADTDNSDVDFLVDFAPGSSLFDLLRIQDSLESLLGCPVDVVPVGGLTERDDLIRRVAVPL